MSARNPCSVMVAGEKKSFALSSLRGKWGTFRIPAYSMGGLPPPAWVISAVIAWLGRVLRSVQESPPSSETKMGAVALAEPPGFGVKAEAAMRRGFEAYSARNGSASCQVSPLSETGIKSTTRAPASLAGGFGTSRSDPLQAIHRATPTAITLARIADPPPCQFRCGAEAVKIMDRGLYRHHLPPISQDGSDLGEDMTRSNLDQARQERPAALPLLLLELTGTTGLIHAVSVLGLGRVFTANMTGNVGFLGFALARVPGVSLVRSLAALAAFLAGAVIGGRLAIRLEGSRRRWLATVAVVESSLLFAAALTAVRYDSAQLVPVARLYALIALTAVAMGLRNATVRRLAVPDLTTTVLTLTLAGLGADSSFAGGANPRFARRVASVAAMLAGAVAGGMLVLSVGVAWPLAVSGAITLLATLIYVGRASSVGTLLDV